MYKPARKIKNTGSKKNTGLFPSIKNERTIAYESLLERDYIYLLEYDKDVISYQEQPVTINYYLNNRRRKYTPDFSVQRIDAKQLIEVKPLSKLNEILADESLSKKYSIASLFCKSNGYSAFKIVTDEDIHTGNVLSNIKYLFSYAKLSVPSSFKLKIRNELILNNSLTIIHLIQKTTIDQSLSSIYHSYILSMLYHQEIITDLEKPIDKNSIVKILPI